MFQERPGVTFLSSLQRSPSQPGLEADKAREGRASPNPRQVGAAAHLLLALVGVQSSPRGAQTPWPRRFDESGSPGVLCPARLLPGSAAVYVFPAAWPGYAALKGKMTTWLQPLFKANRVLTACQAL